MRKYKEPVPNIVETDKQGGGRLYNHAQDHEVLSQLVCDLCGRECMKPEEREWERPYGTDEYEGRENIVYVFYDHFSCWDVSEGAWGTRYEIDLCPVCFMEKLVPWFQSEGGKVNEISMGW